jgi:hypothetical protein
MKARWKAIKGINRTFQEKKFRPYAQRIGQVTMAFNDLHEKLGELYCSVVGGPWERAAAVWSSNMIDRAKRNMLLAAVTKLTEDETSHYPTLFEDVKWLLDASERLEDRRNNAVHAPLVWTRWFSLAGIIDSAMGKPDKVIDGVIQPNVSLFNARAAKLLPKAHDLLQEFRLCHATALLLRNFAFELALAIGGPEHFAWPDKPKLPTEKPKRGHPSQRRQSSQE